MYTDVGIEATACAHSIDTILYDCSYISDCRINIRYILVATDKKWLPVLIWTVKIWTVITNPNPNTNSKPNTNPNSNPKRNTNPSPNPVLTVQILTVQISPGNFSAVQILTVQIWSRYHNKR